MLEKLNLAELEEEFDLGISVDIKMAQLYFGIMEGNGKYPCPFCIWSTDNGIEDGVVYALRTKESLRSNFLKLQTRYRGTVDIIMLTKMYISRI